MLGFLDNPIAPLNLRYSNGYLLGDVKVNED